MEAATSQMGDRFLALTKPSGVSSQESLPERSLGL